MNDQHDHEQSAEPDDKNGPSTSRENIESMQLTRTHAVASAVVVLIHRLIRPPLFNLGQVVATPGAIDLLDRAGMNASALIAKHQRGDWGIVCAEDAQANDQALIHGNRLLSAYELGPSKERLWVITEADRSATTLLLPSEY